LTYRRDIQFLRGVAVLLVVLYHLEIPGFGNGYLGVDIFFVLSGYLMAQLYDKTPPGTFLLRRFKRIAPAYVVTVGLTTLIVGAIALPADANQRFDRLWFDLFALSNLAFFLENSYFDREAFKPLLNLWSLSIEIQYYLLVPLLLPLLRRSRMLLVVVLSVSVLAATILLTISPKISFFLLPGRIWEFLVGAFIAWHVKWTQDEHWGIRGSAVIITLFFVSLIIPVRPDSMSPLDGHPGVTAFVISLIVGLAISKPLHPSVVTSFWAGRPLATLGDYSYSIYLVHFPVIVVVNYEIFGGTRLGFEDVSKFIFILLVTSLITVAMYRFVEPMRKATRFKFHFSALVLAALSLSIAGMLINRYSYDEEDKKIFAAWDDRDVYRCGKLFRALNPFARVCLLREIETKNHSALLVGDSHADSIKRPLAERLLSRGIETYFYVANDPVIGGQISPNTILSDALNLGVDHVIIHFVSGVFRNLSYIDRLTELTTLLRQNEITVLMIAPVPTMGYPVPKGMYEIKRGDRLMIPTMSIREYDIRNAGFMQFTRAMKLSAANVFFPHEILCSERERCAFQESGRPLYFDRAHLTLTGANKLEPLFSLIADKISNGSEIAPTSN